MTHLSTSWAGRRSLLPRTSPLVLRLPCRRPRRFPPGCRSTCCLQQQSRCSWPPSHKALLYGYKPEGLKNASTPWASCWCGDTAWRLLDSMHLKERKWVSCHCLYWLIISYFVCHVSAQGKYQKCVCVCVFILTGWESSILALGPVSRAADGVQLDAVVGATGDAAHQAVSV